MPLPKVWTQIIICMALLQNRATIYNKPLISFWCFDLKQSFLQLFYIILTNLDFIFFPWYKGIICVRLYFVTASTQPQNSEIQQIPVETVSVIIMQITLFIFLLRCYNKILISRNLILIFPGKTISQKKICKLFMRKVLTGT